jgi:hypothetical protein
VRLLVIDECLPKRLVAELEHRGRNAVSLGGVGLRGSLDDPLIERLTVRFPGCVLVTADDAMPVEHADSLRQHRLTVATVDPDRPAEWEASKWGAEVVHRWVHQIVEQPPGSIRRYGLRSRVWTDRRGRKLRRHP